MALEVDITKRLSDFTLRVRFATDGSQEVLALLGPSGCGKSMTLKCIAGIERPDGGRIVLDGRVLFDAEKGIDLPPQRRRVGYLFQSYALFPNMTVEGNVLAGAAGSTKDERRRRAAEAIRHMRLQGLERRHPAELSGGQQQRCAMARILASSPDLILLDEPFSALDGYLRWQLEMELTDVLHEFPGGTVFVSHNRDEVYRLCDTVCVISRGRSDPRCTVRELFEAPRTLAAALISGCKNVSRASRAGEGLLRCDDWGVTLRTTLPCEGATHAGIRAHYFRVGEAAGRNAIPCMVDRVIDSTFSTIVMARTPGGALLRYELEKDEWARLERTAVEHGRLVLAIEPRDVMPLVDGDAEGR
jgi:molybdate transport system ATP-binding protein